MSDSVLLLAKLAPPPGPAYLLERPRLHRALDRAAERALTLLVAPEGWGKTTLLRSWGRSVAGQLGTPAWLSVEADDRGGRFRAYLHAALRTASPEAVAGVPAPAAVSADAYYEHLADGLSRLPRPIILTLDDLQEADDEALAGLEFAVGHASGGLHLVAATQVEPTHLLQRWRLTGHLTELRTRELALTRDETAELLRMHGAAVTTETVDDLWRHTEGWPAGVRLTVLDLLDRAEPADPAETVAHAPDAAVDYLVTEVLERRLSHLREALLRSSVTDQLSGGLINALTGRNDGAAVLADLNRSDTYVVPTGGTPTTHRFHHLFRDVLRAELARRHPDLVVPLHRRAAAWFAASGMLRPALRHALHAGDRDAAVDLVLRCWPWLGTAEHPGEAAASVPVPSAAPEDDPALALAYATDRLDQDEPGLSDEALEATADRCPPLGRAVEAVRLFRAQRSGHPAAVYTAADRLLDQLDSANWPGGPGEDAVAAIALAAHGAAQLGLGNVVDAEDDLSSGWSAATRSGLRCQQLICASRLALIKAERGELSVADQAVDAARRLSPCPGQAPPVHRAHAHLAQAIVDAHRDLVPDALAHLDIAARAGGVLPPPEITGPAATLRAQIGDRAAIQVAQRPPPERLPAGFHDRSQPGSAVDAARAQLDEGEPTRALELLPSWETGSGGPLGPRLEAGVVAALAQRACGRRKEASRLLESLLRMAEPDGYRRVFTRAGQPLRDLLLDHLDSGTAYWATVQSLIGAMGAPVLPTAAPKAVSDPLTDRELTVLRYLQSVLSNGEIATEMTVSVNTVKTHLRNIYRKLDTNHRRDAVRRARELHLL
ncbi:LuxR C-terminal-related transcriptional regulator [Asanoa sp. WMMD1127]|uniref:LuxR C-terminal-related transcriptional regulator n=1 Tax=Asanoa sp. WMMD1127 TaxID=3016107 RepID=UPI0024167511|nr:LuxR C-terminal-related transcriptional regulator [Asanoa sp. WMMD1127]MDG4824980.1 LuxR C-terminal-related transcriptional regulator [Asanoa sp. WMMD1127]